MVALTFICQTHNLLAPFPRMHCCSVQFHNGIQVLNKNGRYLLDMLQIRETQLTAMQLCFYLDEPQCGEVLLHDTIREGWVSNPDALQVQIEPTVFINPVRDVRSIYIFCVKKLKLKSPVCTHRSQHTKEHYIRIEANMHGLWLLTLSPET